MPSTKKTAKSLGDEMVMRFAIIRHHPVLQESHTRSFRTQKEMPPITQETIRPPVYFRAGKKHSNDNIKKLENIFLTSEQFVSVIR